MTGMPRGVAHLQFAKCVPHADFNDALVLKFYASPCARADERVVSEKKKNGIHVVPCLFFDSVAFI